MRGIVGHAGLIMVFVPVVASAQQPTAAVDDGEVVIPVVVSNIPQAASRPETVTKEGVELLKLAAQNAALRQKQLEGERLDRIRRVALRTEWHRELDAEVRQSLAASDANDRDARREFDSAAEAMTGRHHDLMRGRMAKATEAFNQAGIASKARDEAFSNGFQEALAAQRASNEATQQMMLKVALSMLIGPAAGPAVDAIESGGAPQELPGSPPSEQTSLTEGVVSAGSILLPNAEFDENLGKHAGMHQNSTSAATVAGSGGIQTVVEKAPDRSGLRGDLDLTIRSQPNNATMSSESLTIPKQNRFTGEHDIFGSNGIIDLSTKPRLNGSNGCSSSPDRIGPWLTKPACDKHDHCYSAGSGVQRMQCDLDFRKNLITDGVPPSIANGYYGAVRIFGGLFYEGDRPATPQTSVNPNSSR